VWVEKHAAHRWATSGGETAASIVLNSTIEVLHKLALAVAYAEVE